MQVDLESTGAIGRRLRVQIPAERVERAVSTRLKQIASRAKLPGFRPGKAPFKVIEAQYRQSAHYEAINDLVRDTYAEAVSKAQVQPAGYPQFEVTGQTEGLEYVATFEVYPSIALDNINTIKVQRPLVEISEADIDRLIENLRKARKSFDAADRPVQAGDQVTVDFVGMMDGAAFAGGKGDNIDIEVGSGQFLPDLENGLIGHSAGETFDVPVNFPEGYRAEALSGKAAVFNVTLKVVKAVTLPAADDAAFLQAHGISAEGGEAALREKAKSALENERNKAVKNRLKTQILDQLLSAHPIEVPKALIDQEVPRLREEAAARMNNGGTKIKPEKLAEMLPDNLFQATAQRRVSLSLLISEVIKRHDVKLDQARVETTLTEMSADYEQPEDVQQYYRSRNDLMQGLRAVVLEDQVVDVLLANAEVTDVSQTLEQVLNPQSATQA